MYRVRNICVVICIILLTGCTTVTTTNNQNSSSNISILTKRVLSNNGTSYEAIYNSNLQQILLVIRHDYQNSTDIKLFRESMPYFYQKLLKSGATSVPVTITLKKPLSILEAEKFIKRYQLKVRGYHMRIIGKDGKKKRFRGIPQKGILFPDSYKELLPSGNVIGIYNLYGDISIDQFPKLYKDPEVFVPDITSAYAKQMFENSHIYKEFIKEHKNVSLLVQNPDLYSKLEKFGMVKIP
ncbi:hypothetical protein [Saccharococcus caldoxylosilyticus]|uniref:hypothetical protein n=1 Tax=Saccharococcus caldoxylosilyticus TaxID=81408 RepID=UPI0002D2790C|nr:hypothetical protein [Parageobacillus caldoxylosilyticus]